MLVRLQVWPPRETGLSAPLGLAAPQVPSSPYFCRCFGNQPGQVRPRRKLKANFAADEALTFFDAKFAAKIQWRHWKDSAPVCESERWGGGRREYRAAEPGQRRNAREGASPSLFLANFSTQSVKIISKVLRTPRMYLWVLHQGGGGFVKVADRALPGSVRPVESKKDWDGISFLEAEWSEIRLRSPLSSPLSSPRNRA